jgi:Uncharacterized protein conserved in bacteria
MHEEVLNQPHPLVLFDGVCNLCNSSVQNILKRDKHKVFRFASLQSPLGQEISRAIGLPEGELNTMVLVQNGKAHLKSGAALRIARKLPGAWPLLSAFIVVPPLLRNAIYDWVARNRYKWFGRKQECWLPKPEWKDRFVG